MTLLSWVVKTHVELLLKVGLLLGLGWSSHYSWSSSQYVSQFLIVQMKTLDFLSGWKPEQVSLIHQKRSP